MIFRRGTFTFLGCCLLWATGCATLEEYVRFQSPSARLVGARLEGFSLDAVTVVFDVDLTNPYTVSLPLVDLDYSLASGGNAFLSGRSELAGTVPAASSRRVSLPATITYAALLETLAGVRPGSVFPYTADLGLSVEAPLLGRIRIPLRKEGELPVPAPPKVNIAEVAWDSLALNEARGHITVQVENTNRFRLDLSKMNYSLSMNTFRVANSKVEKPVSFAADGGEGTVDIPFSFSPISLGFGVFQSLSSGEVVFSLAGDMSVDTPYGPLSIPLDETQRLVF